MIDIQDLFKFLDHLRRFQAVINIPLAGPLADQNAGISGLTWFGDNLILLPQNPQALDKSGDGYLYYIPRMEITNYVDRTSLTPLEPRSIQLIATDLVNKIPNFKGFESIGSAGPQIFFIIKAGNGTDLRGYLLSGIMKPDLSALLLDTTKLVEIPVQSISDNYTDDSILVLQDELITFYETNGVQIVKSPVAHKYDFDLKPLGTISMTNLEYRLTDTAPISLTEFWGINYFSPEAKELLPTQDPIAEKFGKGESQADYAQIERLVKFQITDSGINLALTAPISLALVNDSRNWEGLTILFDRGFLITTDKYPSTMLGFVPFPK